VPNGKDPTGPPIKPVFEDTVQELGGKFSMGTAPHRWSRSYENFGVGFYAATCPVLCSPA